MSKELQNSDLIYLNLMTDVLKIIGKYHRKVIAKYRHLSPSGNRALSIHNQLDSLLNQNVINLVRLQQISYIKIMN